MSSGGGAAALSAGTLAQIACILEVSARKPGNVHPAQGFRGTTWLDFLIGAAAIAPALDRACSRALGETVLEAAEASRAATGQNVNLGIVLLLAPLAAVPRPLEARAGVEAVLAALGPADAANVYRAIRLAAPGGLGSAPDADVAGPPPGDLRRAMALAQDRDLVARQYANGFRELFDVALPELGRDLEGRLPLEESIIRLHLILMARFPDSLIARKCGPEVALEAARRAGEVLAAGWPQGERAAALLAALDDWLRADGNRRNPGTSADLVSAALFLALCAGIIPLPIEERFAEDRAARAG
jgi:triphosphoribosyl-dephospho-CoA synthase